MPDQDQLLPSLEALLFINGEPLTLARIGKALAAGADELRPVIERLREKHANDPDSAFMLIEQGNALRLATKPQLARTVEAFAKSALQERLSKAALEVLAIIAYRAPVSRSEIEAIRGVNCSFTLRNLLLRGLIDRTGNPNDSRGYIYAPSFRFLETLGLGTVGELPDYALLSSDERLRVLVEGAEASAAAEDAMKEDVS